MGQIIQKNVLTGYKEDMARYSIFVNRKRMVPDRKDGLKTIHRRILFTMFAHIKSIEYTAKSARIVGDVLGKFHPHGDSAAYDAMKPMVNWFETKVPLIIGQGNWGNFQGDTAAAMRYTEAKLSEFAMECVISELKESKQVVDWVDAYTGEEQEPEFLPVAVPLLLINGAFGIGIGLRTEIPRHNVNEVIDATLKLIDDPDAEVVLIPDHCMPCQIIGTNFKAICNKGHGKYKVRGIMDIEEYSGPLKEHKGKQVIVIKSIPDLTFLNSITDAIEKLIVEKKLVQVADAFAAHSGDKKTNRDILRYEIILKRGADANYVRDVIYKNTGMEQSFTVNFEVLDGIEPLRMSYKSYLQAFIEFRKITKFRLYCNQLQAVETEYHQMEAYIKSIQSNEIDNIIYMIRHQQTVDYNTNVEYLIKHLSITDLQAKFILTRQIHQLSEGKLNEYLARAAVLSAQQQELLAKIMDDNLLLKEIKEELVKYKAKYGGPRLCTIIDEDVLNSIPQGEFKIVITENNFIKKIAVSDNVGNGKGDMVKHVLKVDNTKDILLFDEQGKVFRLPVHKVPLAERGSNGTDIRTIIKNLTSHICTVMYLPKLEDLASRTRKYFVTILTHEGNIKKLDIEDFITAPPSGILYMKLDATDFVKDVTIVANELDIIVYSKNKALRMNIEEIPHQKRNTKGMKSMASDFVDGLSLIKPDTTDIIVVTESGKINRFDVVALPRIGRNKAGSNVIKLAKGDAIQCIYGVNIKDTIKVVTKNERYEIKVSELELGSSISGGNKVIPLKGDNIIRCDIIRG